MSYDSNFAPLPSLPRAEEISGNTTLAHTVSGVYKVTGPQGTTSAASISLTGQGCWIIQYDRDGDKGAYDLKVDIPSTAKLYSNLLDESTAPTNGKGLVLNKANAVNGHYLKVISMASNVYLAVDQTGPWTREA